MLILGSDHAGWELKEELKKIFEEKGLAFADISNAEFDGGDDYPDIAFRLGQKVVKEKALGVMICGSGTGVTVATNKVKGVRAARVQTPLEAVLGRLHNNLNVLCLSGLKFDKEAEEAVKSGNYKDLLSLKPLTVSAEEVYPLIEAFLNTPFEGGRHQRRVAKVVKYENNE